MKWLTSWMQFFANMAQTPGQLIESADISALNDEEFRQLLRRVGVELEARQWSVVSAPPGICADLFEVQEAVQRALIANNCLPL